MCARVARLNGSSLQAARDALLRDGKFLLDRIAAYDASKACPADAKGKGKAAAVLGLSDGTFAKTLRAEMAAAFAVAGRLATGAAAVDEAEAALAAFEASVAALAADVTAEVSWRHLLSHDGAEGGDAALRHNVQALGAVCFALGDAARQLARIVIELDPDAAAKAARRSDSSTHDGAMLSAPGGAAPASGGGTMGKALRGAAHALDSALHSYLSARHAPPRQQTQPLPTHKGSRK
jgi:hypothetical protein